MENKILVIDNNGQSLGYLTLKYAQDMARNAGLDLIEVSKQNGQSVFKIGDKGKWLYEQKKKNKHHKQVNHALKEVQFGMRIGQHDENVKIAHIIKFLDKGHPVKVVVEMKGREKAFRSLAFNKLNSIMTKLSEHYCHDPNNKSKLSESQVYLVINPIKHGITNVKREE